MLQYKDYQKIINDKIGELDFNIAPVELYQPIDYVLSGTGKRLRPVLALISCNMFSKEIVDVIKPALGLEIFHNFTLLHDDIMDKADIRRNMPTVHKKWNDNTAILSGDAMMIKAYEFFFSLKPEILAKVLPVFNQTALQVCEGQQYDMNFETRIDVSTNEYIHMITLKTAVLLAASLKIGAIIGGANDKDANLLYDFGINLGLAFQLQDDFLDVYGDVKTFGKQIGGDIVSNKKTFMLISAIENAKGESKKILFELINSSDIESSKKIKEVTQIYNQLNIPFILKEKLDYFHDLAINNLKQISVKEENKNILVELSGNLLVREK